MSSVARGAVVLVASVSLVACSSHGDLTTTRPSAATVGLGERGVHALATDGRLVWYTAGDPPAVGVYDTSTRSLVDRVVLPGDDTAEAVPLDVGGGALWLSTVPMGDGPEELVRLDTASGTATTVPLQAAGPVEGVRTGGSSPSVSTTAASKHGISLAFVDGAAYVTWSPGSMLRRLDVATGGTTDVVALADEQMRLEAGCGSLWAATSEQLQRIDPATSRIVSTFRWPKDVRAALGGGLDFACVDEEIWVSSSAEHLVAVLDARDGRQLATVAVGNDPSALAVGSGSVWVVDSGSQFMGDTEGRTLVRIDAAARHVVDVYPTGDHPADVVVAAGSVWVLGWAGTNASLTRVDP